MSVRWRRNRSSKCCCGGYHFPHRRGGGACDHSRTAVFHRLRRQGESVAEARLGQALAGVLVFIDSPECPF